jgi:hypothetical protein
MKLEDFLKRNFDKDDLQRLIGYISDKTTGTKENLIKRIIENYEPTLKTLLLKNFSRYGLEKICSNINVKNKGTVTEITKRILDSIDFPNSDSEFFHRVKIDHKRREIIKYNYDQRYFLENFFSKDELKEILAEHGLPLSGDKETQVDRILENINPSRESILEKISYDSIESLCEELEIERKGTFFRKENPLPLILKKLKEFENKKESTISKLIKPELSTPVQSNPTLKDIHTFLKEYKFLSDGKVTEKILQEELFYTLIETFGRENVIREPGVGAGRIDFDVHNVGIELKFFKKDSTGELDRMIGQINRYKATYKENLILLIVNNNPSTKELERFLEPIRKENIAIIVKQY